MFGKAAREESTDTEWRKSVRAGATEI